VIENAKSKDEIFSELTEINDWKHPFDFIKDNLEKFERSELSDWNKWRASVSLNAIESVMDLDKYSLADFACNDGFFSFQIADKVTKGFGFEARDEALRRANLIKDYYGYKNFNFKKVDLRNFDMEKELGTEVFDLSLCYGVLYHVTDPFQLLKNIKKVTKHALSISTFLNTYEEPVLTLYKEDISMPGSGLEIISTRPSYQAVIRMLYGVGFDLVLRYVPYKLSICHHQHWGQFFGVNLRGKLEEEYCTKHNVRSEYNHSLKEDQLILCNDVYEDYLGKAYKKTDYLKPSFRYLLGRALNKMKRIMRL